MRAEFSWYLNNSPEHADKIWSEAILTVDANVLLDLYRYHDETRDRILSALEGFAPRVWISFQAATEFFRNRKGVIASAEKTFRDANAAINQIEKDVGDIRGKLGGHRLVRNIVSEELSSTIRDALNKARNDVASSKRDYPNYFTEDNILSRILSLFDKKVGQEPTRDEQSSINKEAERRIKDKIPPGFMDAGKEGDRRFGDYAVWFETIQFAKDRKKTIIMVTSEQKEDWWEKSSGKIVGPRSELIQEFNRETGQQIYVYQTDHFTEITAKRAGLTVPTEIVEEIRQIAAEPRQHISLSKSSAQTAILNDDDMNFGLIRVIVTEEKKRFKAFGSFNPPLSDDPIILVFSEESSLQVPHTHIKVTNASPSNFSFEVKDPSGDTTYPPGEYIFNYTAAANKKR